MIIAKNALFSDNKLHTIIETTIHIITYTYIHKHVVNIVILYMCCFSDYLLLSVFKSFKFNLKTNKRHKYAAFVLIKDIRKFPVFMLGWPKVIHFQRSFISTKVFLFILLYATHILMFSRLYKVAFKDIWLMGKAIGLHFT